MNLNFKIAVLVWSMMGVVCHGAGNFENPSFEKGTDGWTIQYDEKGMDKPWSIDPQGYQSAQSLKVVLPNPFAMVTLENTQPITLPDPTKPYVLSFACRFENPLLIRALAPRAQFLTADGSPMQTLFGEGWELAESMVLYLVGEEKVGDWNLRHYAIPPVKDAKAIKVTLEFYGAKGAFWIDGLNLEKRDGGRTPEKFLYYNPFNAPLGIPPYDHLVKLTREGSPWLKSGDAFNRAMVAQSLAQEKLEEWERACGYLGKKADEALAKENEHFLSRLNALYETFGKLFLAKTPEKLEAEINQPAASLRTEIEKYQQRIEKFLKQETEKAGGGANGGTVTGMAVPKPIVIDERGRPNQLVFGSLSKAEHFEMEKNLCDFKRVYVLYKYHGFGYDLSPDKKSVDFDAVKKEIEKWSAQGVEYSFIGLPFSDAGGNIVLPEFLEKNWNDPEIYMQQKYKPPAPAFNQDWSRKPYNIFNPAVREACREAAAAFGKNLKEYKKIYGFCREGGGPFVNGRTAGYGEVAQREFQKHLEHKFGSIQKLNAAWKTDYRGFEDISQPLDKRSMLGKYPYNPIPVTKPLTYEFESWIHQVAVDFNIMIYREIKKYDPQAIVMSDHNDVFENMGFNPMTLFDYCDMVSNHAKPHLIDIFRSLARHRPDKNFGAHEDQWGLLWEEPRFGVAHRPSEERAWRSYIIKHVGKLADRDYTMQSWWYSYTRGEFILGYGSGHWAVPAYDLTIFRYWFTGLPTGIEMVRHFETQLMNSRKAPSRILLMIPEASFYHQYESGLTIREITKLHRLLFPLNYSFESSTERLILEGKEDLSAYDVILSPFAPYYPRGLWEILKPWLKNGGQLISIGPCGIFDEYGFDNPESLTQSLIKTEFPSAAFNGRYFGDILDWGWKNGEAIQRQPVGKGSLVLLTRPIYGITQNNRLLEQFLKIFDSIPREAKSPNTPVELTLRKNQEGRYYLFAVNPNGDTVISGDLQVSGDFSKIQDLGVSGGFPVKSRFDSSNGHTTFAFQLAPGGFTLFDLGFPKLQTPKKGESWLEIFF